MILRFDADLNVVYVSPNVQAMYGLEPEDVLGHKYRSIPGYQQSAGPWSEMLLSVFESGTQKEIELQNAPKEAPIIANWRFIPEFDSKGKVASVLAVVRDVTAHRKAEKDFAMLFERMLDGFVLHEVIFDEDGKPYDSRIMAVNPAFENLTGLRADVVVGKRTSEVLPSSRNDWGNRFGPVVLTGEPITFTRHMPHIGKYFNVTVFQPAPTQLAAIFSDITQSVHDHEKLQQAQQELESRVELRTRELNEANLELEKFSYSISHDLRAPLRAINGFAHMLGEDYGEVLDDDGKETLGRISSAANKMSDLVDGLLRLSRVHRSELNIQELNLSEICAEYVSQCKSQSPKRKTSIHIQKNVMARGDDALVRSLVDNLISNAFKYSSKKELTRIEFGKTEINGETVLFVRDNGAGFDMKYVDKLFGAFQRLHSDKEFAGIGIGLATVKRIVSRHGGRIWAESEPDKGTTFYFTLSA